MAVDPDYVFHLVTGGPIGAPGSEEGYNPIRKGMQDKVDHIRALNLERNGEQGVDRILVVVLGNQELADRTEWPGLVTSWFWGGVPEVRWQPALTVAKTAPLPEYQASLKKPIVMTNRGLLVRGEKVNSFTVVGTPGPNERGSRACGMQFLDELWDSARDAQSRLTAYDENVEVHLNLTKSDPESISLVHKWCSEKGIETPAWLNPAEKKNQNAGSAVCPGMERLEGILKPAEMELLQTQYEEISGEGEGLEEGGVEPILCSAGRFAKIKQAVRGFMPDDLFRLMFATASAAAAREAEDLLEAAEADRIGDDIIIIEETRDNRAEPRVHPRDRLGAEITDLRSVIGGGGGSGGGSSHNLPRVDPGATRADSAMLRLGSPVADSNPMYDDFAPSSGSGYFPAPAPPQTMDAAGHFRPRQHRSRSPLADPETDELVLVRREKDIYVVKNEHSYLRYLQAVPKDRRAFGMPGTPDIRRRMSTREWEDTLKHWKYQVQRFDPEALQRLEVRAMVEGGDRRRSRSRSPLRRSPSPQRFPRSPERPRGGREAIAREVGDLKLQFLMDRKRPRAPKPTGELSRKTDPALVAARQRMMNDVAWNFPKFKRVYDRYVAAVPKEQRRPEMPTTPPIHQPNHVNSKEFSKQVSNWKQAVYAIGDSLGEGAVARQKKQEMDDLAWNHPEFRKVYNRYVEAVPKEQRGPDMPRTPDIHRSTDDVEDFSRLVTAWKQAVYAVGDSLAAYGDDEGVGRGLDNPLDVRRNLLDNLAWNLPKFKTIYDRYVAAVPKEQRRPDLPQTPDIHMDKDVSRTQFTKKVHSWKKQVYALETAGSLTTLEKRKKTMSFVKKTPEYLNYEQAVPKELRRPEMPRTPDYQDLSMFPKEFHLKTQGFKKALKELERSGLYTDETRNSTRQRQIDQFKNTDSYQRYLKMVPKEQRSRKMPMTPKGHEVEESISVFRDWKKSIYNVLASLTKAGYGLVEEDNNVRTFNTEEHKILKWRQTQIDFFKNSDNYARYLQAVPKEQRRPDMPATPDIHKNMKMSRNEFSKMLSKDWRKPVYLFLDSFNRETKKTMGDHDGDARTFNSEEQDILKWRQRQIDFYKSTKDYQDYLVSVPKEQRRPNMPATPDIHRNMQMSQKDFSWMLAKEWKEPVRLLLDPHTSKKVMGDKFGPLNSEEEEILKWRQIQINFFKNSNDYARYVQVMPKEQRRPDMPATPDIHRNMKMSRSQFSKMLVKDWKEPVRSYLDEVKTKRPRRESFSPRRSPSRRSPSRRSLSPERSSKRGKFATLEGRSGRSRRDVKKNGAAPVDFMRGGAPENPIVIGGARVPSGRAPDLAAEALVPQQWRPDPRPAINPEPHPMMVNPSQVLLGQMMNPEPPRLLPLPQHNFPLPQQNLAHPPLDNFPRAPFPAPYLPPQLAPPPLNAGFNPPAPPQGQFPGEAQRFQQVPERFPVPQRRSPPRLSPGSSAMGSRPMDISPPRSSRSPGMPRAGFSSDFSQYSKTGFGFPQTKFGESPAPREVPQDFRRIGGVFIDMEDARGVGRRDRSPTHREPRQRTVSPPLDRRPFPGNRQRTPSPLGRDSGRRDFPGERRRTPSPLGRDSGRRDFPGERQRTPSPLGRDSGRRDFPGNRQRTPSPLGRDSGRRPFPGNRQRTPSPPSRDSGRGPFPGNSGRERRLSPEKEKEPAAAVAPADLSLSAHFCLRQKKLGRPAESGGDMMLTWDGRLVGHNEDTLRQLCRKHDPDSPEKLRILLMREIMHAKNVPSTVDVGDIVDETVLYFMPFEEDINPRHSLRKNQNPSLEEKTLQFLQDLQAKNKRTAPGNSSAGAGPSSGISPGDHQEQRFSYVERIASLYGFQTFLIQRLRSIPEMASIPDDRKTRAVENLLRDLASVGIHQSSLNRLFSRFGEEAVKDVLVGKLTVMEAGFEFGITAKLIGNWACVYIREKVMA